MFVDEKRIGEVTPLIESWQQLLLRAADILENNGWCQDNLTDHEGRHCAMGAMFESARYYRAGSFNKAESEVREQLWGAPITRWNDSPGRTKEEVVGLLRGVATK